MDTDNKNRWNAKHDISRNTSDFSDLLKIITGYYEMYQRASNYLGPWISKQAGMMFIPPDKETIKTALGKENPNISYRARTAFIDCLVKFVTDTKGRKALIHPNPSTHHSAQFPSGTFEITQIPNGSPKKLYKIDFAHASDSVYIENLMIPPEQVKFIILRPKLGKLGTASVSKWEVLLFKQNNGYLVEHVDSDKNPRYSGIL